MITSCKNCNSSDIRPEQDVMDTWNTSSLTPYICKQLYSNQENSPFKDDSFIPMSMRPQAHDIIRTWAFYTIAKSWMHQNQIPWKDIVISGYVLSENKEKISKSKNNAPTDPEKLLTQFPPDAIRFWTASATLGQDTAFSPEQMAIGQKLITKLWNALKFTQMNIQDQNIPTEQPKLDLINTWMIQQVDLCLNQYHAYFEKQEFSLALQVVEHVFWQDFCDNYIEIIKDQFFNPQNYNPEQVMATRWTLRQVSFSILQLYAPYIPHITEYLYQHILQTTYTAASLHLTQLPTTPTTQNSAAQDVAIILNTVRQVRKLKTAHQLSLKTEFKTLTIGNVSEQEQQVLTSQINLLKGICKSGSILFTKESIEQTISQKDEILNAYINNVQD